MKRYLVLACCLMLVTASFAQTKLQFTTFDNEEKFALLGDARIINGNVRLTEAAEWQRGACWYKRKVPVSDGFEVEFKVLISKNGGSGNGADGFTFVIQNDPYKKGLGRAGEGLGYSGLSNAMVIEFDTYDNQEGSSNHVSFQNNKQGMVSRHNFHSIFISHTVPNLKGITRTVKIVYADKRMKVYVSGKLVANKALNLANYITLDKGKAWIGFTASTAMGYSQHEILEWKFKSRVVPRA